MQSIMFYIFSFGAIVSAFMMVTNKKPVSAAMNLIVTMFCLAGIYVLLDAHLIAALQIIVYAGAIMVLFLFVIMLLNIQEKEGKLEGSKTFFQFISILIVGSLFIAIANLAKTDGNLVQITNEVNIFGTVKSVARLLFTDYILPFEIASILLLAAIVGAVIIAKRRIND